MSDDVFEDLRYFLATSGVKLPLKLVNQIDAGRSDQPQHLYPRAV